MKLIVVSMDALIFEDLESLLQKPTFLAHGPGFQEGAILEHADLTNTAPTYAAVLGTKLPQAQGRVLRELLK